MTCKEQQDEELEVLHSIYEGDENFKEVNQTTFQYKYGEDGGYRSFNVEILWGEDYPEKEPRINLDTFYNKHILENVKAQIMSGLKEQIPDLLDSAMTYTLFEWVKENYDDLVAEQPESAPVNQVEEREAVVDVAKKKEKKEQLTKQQKRKMFDRIDASGERPRGWNWVDVIRHLSQTGSQNS